MRGGVSLTAILTDEQLVEKLDAAVANIRQFETIRPRRNRWPSNEEAKREVAEHEQVYALCLAEIRRRWLGAEGETR